MPYAYQYPREERVVIKPVTPFVEESDPRVIVPEVIPVGAVELSKLGILAKVAKVCISDFS